MTFRSKEPLSNYAQFLVFAHSGIGDTIWLLSTLEALRRFWPNTTIRCTVNNFSKEVLDMSGLDLDFISWPKYWRRDSIRTLSGLAALSRCKPDVFLVPPSFDAWLAAWVAFLSRAKKSVAIVGHRYRRRPGFSFLVGRAFTDLIPGNDKVHWIDQIHSMLDCVGPPVQLRQPRLVLSGSIVQKARERMTRIAGLDIESEPYFVGHLGCEPLLRAKLWPTEKMMGLLARVSEKKGMRCVMVWGRDDVDLIKRASDIAGNSGWFIRVPWEASVSETAGILSRARLLITHDSGIMHLAAAQGTRVLAVFGPTSHWLCGPYDSGSAVVYREVECGPCYPRADFFACPYGRKCLTGIQSELVAGIAENMIDEVPVVGREEIADKIFLSPSPCR